MQRSTNRRRAYHRRRQRRRLTMFAVIAAVIVLAVALIIALMPEGADKPGAVQTTPTPTPSATVEVTPTPTPTAAPTLAPTGPYAANAVYRPDAREGWLPVLKKADTQAKVIAITIDDCYEAENLRTLVQGAIDYGAKLTLFPAGQAVIKAEQAEILKWAWENGMELENHTYTNSALYDVDDERLAKEVYMQNLALSKILNLEYQVHFLRPDGGIAKDDQRTHAYAAQLGYHAIAHWSVSGTDTKMEDLPSVLKPGAVYVFNTTDSDLKKLSRFIPYAIQQGYRLVTLNEMFGYPVNETQPLTIPIMEHTVPELQPYEEQMTIYSQPAYAHGVKAIQEKLIALGYLDGTPDGAYGPSCAAAVRKFQQENGLPATGEADENTQKKLAERYSEKQSNLSLTLP